MSILGQFQSLPNQIFDAFGDVPVVCSYTDSSGSTWDRSTGAVTDSGTTYTTEAFVLSFKQEERAVDESIGDKDKKIIVNASGLSVEPQIDDTLTADGEDFVIRKLSSPLPGTIWVIHGSPA